MSLFPIEDPLCTEGPLKNLEINYPDGYEELILRRRIVMVKIELTKGGACISMASPEGKKIGSPMFLNQNMPEVVIRTAAVMREER